ncbi:Rhodanese-like protein [Lichtheimia hyalospora FSU 10163]|nr:Rhodanese-like protein [Lichtheimia hyalospora FSU 10163]
MTTRRFTAGAENNTVDYDYIQTIIKDKKQNTHLIDVREPNELLQGSIPSAKNVPLSKFLVAWSMSEEDFEDEFGFEKPSEKDEVVLYCQAGIRSNKAADFLRDVGYMRVFNYPGSWADYAERTKSG